MSVWQDIESLHGYVYQSAHMEIMSQRKQWFEMMRESYSVLWWPPVGEIPRMEQAKQKLELIRESGPRAEAFTFKKAFAPPASGTDMPFTEMDEPCPAT